MAATQLSSFFSQRSRTLSRLPSSPLGDRGPLLVPFLRRLDASPFSLITASILTLQISALSRSQTRRTGPALSAWNGLEEAQTSGYQIDEDVPSSIDLLPISSEEQFDSIIAKAQLLEESLIILWMANWCRKCIYLKPKLEKLATDYYPRIRFCCVDVNSVPQKLVNRAGVTKMPTIQDRRSRAVWEGSSFLSEPGRSAKQAQHVSTFDRPFRTAAGMTCSGQQVRSGAPVGRAGQSNCTEQPIVSILNTLHDAAVERF